MHKFLLKASALIKKHDYDKWQEFHLCAIIVQGGNILSVGFNQSRRHGYVEVIKKNSWTNLHAEVDAILKVRRKINLTGSKMFIVRLIEGDTKMSISRPCQTCQIALKNYGIKKVYYSIDDDTYAVMKI